MRIDILQILKIVLLVTSIFSVGYGQNIDGKWIELKDRESHTHPSINILEFNKSKLIQYDFDKKIDSALCTIERGMIYLEATVKRFRLINDDILELTGLVNFNGKDSIMTIRFLRLTATDFELPKENTESKSIILYWNDHKNIISFNNSISTNDFQVSRFKTCKDVRLENIDLMLFISVFCNNKRKYVFPIKKITPNDLTLYINGITEVKAEIKNTNHCKAQSPILNMEVDTKYDAPNNSYYKDINNVLNDYEGTWLYTNGNTSLKITLIKSIQYFNGKFYEDVLIGGYQYIENGVEKINTLYHSNDPSLGRNASIKGNNIYNNCKYLPADDCMEGEKRLDLSIVDITSEGHIGDLILHRRVVNGQDALKINIDMNYLRSEINGEIPEPTLPWQMLDIILIKQ